MYTERFYDTPDMCVLIDAVLLQNVCADLLLCRSATLQICVCADLRFLRVWEVTRRLSLHRTSDMHNLTDMFWELSSVSAIDTSPVQGLRICEGKQLSSSNYRDKPMSFLTC